MLMPQSIRLAIDSAIGGLPPRLPVIGRLFEPWLSSLGTTGLLAFSAGLSLSLTLASGLLALANRACLSIGSEGAIKDLRDRLYQHIQRLPYKWHAENHTGDIVQRATSDVGTIKAYISSQAVEVIRTVFMISVALSFMFSMNRALSYIAVAFVPVVIGVNTVYYSISSKRFLAADEHEGELMSIAQENFTGVRVVRAFGMESYERDRFNSQNEIYTQAWVKLGSVLGAFWAVNSMLTGLQRFSIIIGGCFLAVSGELTVGEFLVFISYYNYLQWPVRSLGRTISEMSRASASAIRLAEILDAEAEDIEDGLKEPAETGDIVFDSVSFAYANTAAKALDNVSFTVPKGSSFGILGPTGSGKSTIASLLIRLYEPSEGKITYGGIDTADISLPFLRNKIGLVLQETFLFSKTLEENIAIGVSSYTPDDMAHAINSSGMASMVEEMPQGLDTVVGERGVTLSGGQKQRAAIARMLLRGADVFIFDDSLSAVDMITDLEIRRALKQEAAGKTSIIISHRTASLMHCDRILVIEGGKATDIGSHSELIRREGLYKRVFEKQSDAYPEAEDR